MQRDFESEKLKGTEHTFFKENILKIGYLMPNWKNNVLTREKFLSVVIVSSGRLKTHYVSHALLDLFSFCPQFLLKKKWQMKEFKDT